MNIEIRVIRSIEDSIESTCRSFKAEGLVDMYEIITFIDSIICLSPSLHKIYEKDNDDSLEICLDASDDDKEKIKKFLQSDKVIKEYFSSITITGNRNASDNVVLRICNGSTFNARDDITGIITFGDIRRS